MRIYKRKRGRWHVALDFATTPLWVGAGPEPRPERKRPRAKPIDLGAPLGYAQVQALFTAMGKDASTAPHVNFWELDYQAFVDFVFEYELIQGDVKVRMLVPYHSKRSNLIRALVDDAQMTCAMNGRLIDVDVRRMPVGADQMTELQIAKLAAWVDAGCPEVGGQPSTQPRRPPEELLRCVD